MDVLPVYVGHDKNGSISRFDVDGSDGVPALLSGFIHTILRDQAMLIRED
jgi:hypothetical protein